MGDSNVFDNFMGYNFPADGQALDSGSYTITTTDGTGLWNDDNKIYIGDAPNPALQFGDDPNTGIYIGDPTDNELYWSDNTNNPYLTVNPSINYWGTSGTTISIGYNSNDKYAVFDLPREGMPIAVYVCGRMLTLGILGTDVECAFTGDKLVFEPGAVSAISWGNRITISLEYADEIYHYNVGSNGQIEYLPNSSTLVTTLVSTLKKEVPLTGAK